MLRYLGTVSAKNPPPPPAAAPVPQILLPSTTERQQTWHLKDSDERACAVIAGRICFIDDSKSPDIFKPGI